MLSPRNETSKPLCGCNQSKTILKLQQISLFYDRNFGEIQNVLFSGTNFLQTLAKIGSTLIKGLNGRYQVLKRKLIDRRASHFAKVNVSKELQGGKFSDRRVILR